MIAHAKPDVETEVLFLGGPWDGRRMEVPPDVLFVTAPEWTRPWWSDFDLREPGWRMVTYRRERFCCGGNAVWYFFVEELWTAEDLAVRLFGSLPHVRRRG